MACYGLLPSEIRQCILQLVLRDAGTLTRDLSNLILIDRQTFEDVKSILSVRMPIYVMGKPSLNLWPATQLPYSDYSLPRPSSVCLSLFHTAQADVLHNASGSHPLNHHDLLKQWETRLPQILPQETRRVLVDATPAPGYIRKKGPEWVATMVNDSRVTRFFMARHTHLVTNVIKSIPQSCRGAVDIVLTGTYSVSHRSRIDEIVRGCRKAGLEISTEVDLVKRPPPTLSPRPLSLAIQQLRPPRSETNPKRKLRWVIACRKMQTTQWRQSTQDLHRCCEMVNKQQTSHIVECVLRFEAQPQLQSLDLPPSELLLRKLAHRMAYDMGWWTESVGEEPNRFVRLTGGPVVRQPPNPS